MLTMSVQARSNGRTDKVGVKARVEVAVVVVEAVAVGVIGSVPNVNLIQQLITSA